MLSVIPNLITGLRFVLVIPISVSIYQENYFTALVLFIVAGLSDGLDGYLARRFNWTSEFGQFADPLADPLPCSSPLQKTQLRASSVVL